MNDFTKEELEDLHSCLDQCKFDDGTDDALMKKLEVMIDNYCEHESTSTWEGSFCNNCGKGESY